MHESMRMFLRNIIKFLVIAPLLIVFALLTSCQKEKKAKYIFYFIGDGFGYAHAQLTENYLDAINADTATVHLDLLKMPVSGTITTFSANKFTTCSSAAGTALATGSKTNNGMLGISPSGEELTSIAEILRDKDYNIGIITSVALDHATPASFYGNVKSRSSYLEISKQLAVSEFEYFGGGGLLGSLKDSSIWNTLKENGYKLIVDGLSADNSSSSKLFSHPSELCPSQGLTLQIDNPSENSKLKYFVKEMIQIFEASDKPFFTMIEGGKIDFESHRNDAAAMLNEVLAFNEAYKEAYEFYLRHPDETLIIMTSDHETGGLALGNNFRGYDAYPALLANQKMSVPSLEKIIEARYPNKISKKEVYSLATEFFALNSDSLNKDAELLKLNKKDSLKVDAFLSKPHNNKDLAMLFASILDQKAGVAWTTHAHTGICVAVRAIGVGSEMFVGNYDNTDIPKKILEICSHEGVK